MFNTVKRIAVGLAALSISVGAFAQSDRAMDLDALLKQLEEGQFAQSQQNKQRERDFQAQRAEQDRILRETREKRDQMLAQSEQLETQFEENEFKLADLNGALDTRDASMQGVWNKQTRQWEELDSSYRTQITKGLRMAKKQLAPDLLMLPVAITD